MKSTTIIGLLFVATSCFAQEDAADIASLLSQTFNRPKATVISNPVVVEGDYAIADWTQGLRGGRALLSKQSGQWKIISCGGVKMTKKESLRAAGMPAESAAKLERRLFEAEAKLSKDQVHLFNSFKGELKH